MTTLFKKYNIKLNIHKNKYFKKKSQILIYNLKTKNNKTPKTTTYNHIFNKKNI